MLLACVGATYLTLASACAVAKAPWWDEAWFANPAYNLAVHGTTGTNVLAGTPWLPHVERYTYWIMPLYPVALAGWFKAVGFGLVRVRLFSTLWGVVGLCAWFWILSLLTGSTGLATLGVALIGLDNSWITLASEGRMDLMAAALGFAGYAVYLWLRPRGFTRAFCCGHALVAAGMFTHVYGALAFVGLWLLALTRDRDRMRWRTVAPAALPYLLAAAGWGLYILQSPADFYVQFAGNSAGRLHGLGALAAAVEREVGRYASFYTVGPQWMAMRTGAVREWFHHYLGAIPILYAVAILGGAAVAEIRGRPDWRVMLALAVFALTVFTVADWHKRYYYLVYVVPLYGALSAIVAHWLWHRWPGARPLLAAGICSVVGLNVGGAVDQIRSDTYVSDYAPVAHYLASHAGARDTVIGPAELAFTLRYDGRLVDDQTLGVASGIRSEYIVMGSRYAGVLNDPTEPEAWRDSLRRRLTVEYRKVFDGGEYRVYRRRPAATLLASPPQRGDAREQRQPEVFRELLRPDAAGARLAEAAALEVEPAGPGAAHGDSEHRHQREHDHGTRPRPDAKRQREPGHQLDPR